MSDLKTRLANMSPSKRREALESLPSYLAEASEAERLQSLLANFDFIDAKVSALVSQPLIADYDLAYNPDILLSKEKASTLKIIQGALRLSAHVLDWDKTQLVEQLWGRLVSFEALDIQAMLEQARQSQTAPWLRPLNPILTRPGGALLHTLNHTHWINTIAITPDGKQLVSSSGEDIITVWDLESGRKLKTFSGHSSSVIAFTTDSIAVSALDDETLKFWDLESGKELKTLLGYTSFVQTFAITPNGKLVLWASGNTLEVWDVELGKKLRILSGHIDEVTAVVITPDGKQAVSASGGEGTLKAWDLASGKELQTLAGHTEYIRAIAVISDGKQVVSVDDDDTLIVWDLQSGNKLKTIEAFRNVVQNLAITPDGKVAVSRDFFCNNLLVWDLESRNVLQTLSGHGFMVVAVAITPNGKRFASFINDDELNVGHSEYAASELHCCTVAPDGVTIVAGARSG